MSVAVISVVCSHIHFYIALILYALAFKVEGSGWGLGLGLSFGLEDGRQINSGSRARYIYTVSQKNPDPCYLLQ